MDRELLEIIPRELKFTFELKKQSSCSVQLVNNSDQDVAFKVKTTSPKKYCVRPNTGIIHPKSACDFTVTMQAQRVAPPDLVCKDKFLIQGTIVPYGTAAESITPAMFAKDSGRYIEENKLKVILISPPQSPILLPINGVVKEDYEGTTLRDQVSNGVENLPPFNKEVKDNEHLKAEEELKPPVKDVIVTELKQSKDVEFKLAEDVEDLKPINRTVQVEDLKQSNNNHVGEEELKSYNKKFGDEFKSFKISEELDLVKDIQNLKSKLNNLEAKLSGAQNIINTLEEERNTTTVERETLQQQLAMLRRKSDVQVVARRGRGGEQVGFPLLFVVMVALIGIAVGYLLRN